MSKQLTVPTVIRARGDEPEIVISTGAVDREGDILEPDGAELAEYRANPVVGFAHFRQEPLPVGATTSIIIEPGRGLRARWRWLEGDPFAARVRNAFDQGVLRGASVGFLPLESSPRAGGRGTRFSRWSLLEWSLCPVPANPQCVRVLRSLELYDPQDDAFANITRLEPLSAAAGPRTTTVDEDELADIVADAIRDQLDALIEKETRAAINYLRGRID